MVSKLRFCGQVTSTSTCEVGELTPDENETPAELKREVDMAEYGLTEVLVDEETRIEIYEYIQLKLQEEIYAEEQELLEEYEKKVISDTEEISALASEADEFSALTEGKHFNQKDLCQLYVCLLLRYGSAVPCL